MKKINTYSGWLNFYKPEGMTSTQAVGKMRRLFKTKKVGHAGTLDPLACGVLPIALAEATKTIPYIQDREKTYRFRIIWGSATTTEDREGDVIETSNVRPSCTDIKNIFSDFTGKIEQIPPRYSAIKIDGKRAYDLARAGQVVKMKPRQVTIHSLSLIKHSNEWSEIDCTCGKGTYIRSLARDIAKKLGSCAHVGRLERLSVGSFMSKNAFLLDDAEKIGITAQAQDFLIPLPLVLDDILALDVTEKESQLLKQGREIIRPQLVSNNETAMTLFDGTPIAMVQVTGNIIKPLRVFNM